MRPALWIAASLALGIAAAQWLRPHPALALLACIAPLVWAVCDRRRGTLALLLAVFCTGALRYSYVQTVGRGDLGAWQGQKVAFTATVTGEPELRKPSGVGYVAVVETVDGRPAKGKLYITQRAGTAPSYGERVSGRGTLTIPPGPRAPGGYDRGAHLARQGIYLEVDASPVLVQGFGRLNPVRKAAVALRNQLEGVLKAMLPPREAGLMAGLLLGSRRDLTDDIKEAFKASGVFHLLAVSGAHVAMIILPLLGLLRRAGLSPRGAAATLIPVVLFFIFLTGAGPSVLRAGLMAVLVLLGDLLRRERDTANTLAAACLILLLWQPTLLFEVGFQLSVAATLGILIFARPIERWLAPWCEAFFGARAGPWIAMGLSATLGAELMVEPVSLHYFGHISTIAPVANLLLALFLAPVLQFGALAALVGLASPLAAWLLGWLVRLGLWLLIFTVKATAGIPGAYPYVGNLPVWGILAWYVGLTLATAPTLRTRLLTGLSTAWRTWAEAGRLARVVAAVLLALLLSSGFVWRGVLAGPPDQLQVTFFDVGQGDAILIQAPGRRTMLIDTGPASPPDPARGTVGWDAGEAVILPFLSRQGVRRLDYLVLTHPHQDHVGGAAAVLSAIPVGVLVENGMTEGPYGYTDAMAVVASRSIPVRRPVAGDQIRLGPAVVLEVLGPPSDLLVGTRSDANSNSVILRLRYRDVAILLTGDMEEITENWLLAQEIPLRADVLKVAHHGSAHSTSDRFLDAVRPTEAIISLGRGNLFGHPSPATVGRLTTVGARVHRTDQLGSITLRTDGQRITLAGTRQRDESYRPLGVYGRRLIFAW